jgi:Uma2 family endonuclease
MEDLLEPLVRSPKLIKLTETLRRKVLEEKRQRRKFYDIINEDKKIEFINGEIIMHSPVRLIHSETSDNLNRLLSIFVDKYKLGQIRHEKILISLSRNDYEPDICFFKYPKYKEFKPDQLQFPAPDMIVEIISKSTEVFDRGVKFIDYATHGIEEYWLIDPELQIVEQYFLKDEEYFLNVKLRKQGIIESLVIKDFKINIEAIFKNEKNLEAISEILSSGKNNHK